MKRLIRKTKGLVRGTPTAVLISAAVHGALLLLATGFVVFTIIEKQEAKFVPQKIDRPKMQLKKLRVKVKEQAKPRKTTQRIASSRKSADLPDIQLPEMTGMGAGLEGAIGGFDMMADLSSMTLFGGQRSLGNDLEGTFYHLMRDRAGNPLTGYKPVSGAPNMKYMDKLNMFIASGWDSAVLDQFYRSPTKLYATHFMFCIFASELALKKFNMGDDQYGGLYIIHYKGKISHPTGGRFRFWGTGDDFLLIRINGKLVLDGRTVRSGHYGNWNSDIKTGWESSEPQNWGYPLGFSAVTVGDWFALGAGEPVEMEVLIGEDQGGRTACLLNVEEFGVEYPENEYGAPILPAFKTAKIPEHIIDEIEYLLIPGESDLKGGPVFSAY